MSGAHRQHAIYMGTGESKKLYDTYSDRHKALTALHGLRNHNKGVTFTLEGHDR